MFNLKNVHLDKSYLGILKLLSLGSLVIHSAKNNRNKNAVKLIANMVKDAASDLISLCIDTKVYMALGTSLKLIKLKGFKLIFNQEYSDLNVEIFRSIVGTATKLEKIIFNVKSKKQIWPR